MSTNIDKLDYIKIKNFVYHWDTMRDNKARGKKKHEGKYMKSIILTKYSSRIYKYNSKDLVIRPCSSKKIFKWLINFRNSSQAHYSSKKKKNKLKPQCNLTTYTIIKTSTQNNSVKPASTWLQNCNKILLRMKAKVQ